MSIHTGKAILKARRLGALGGEPEAAPLFKLSKRELIEIALRLTMKESAQSAVTVVKAEYLVLKENSLI